MTYYRNPPAYAPRDRASAPAAISSNRRNFSAAPRRRFARPNRPRNRATLPPLPSLRPGEQRYLGKPKEELEALATNPIRLPPLDRDLVYIGAKKILVKKPRGHDTITSEIEIPKISNLFVDPFDGRTLEIHRVAKTTAEGLCATEEGRKLNKHIAYLETWAEACAGSAQTSFNQNQMVMTNEFCQPGGIMWKALRDMETEEQTDRMFKVIFAFGNTIDGDALFRVNRNLKHLIESIKNAVPGVPTEEDKILPRLEWASEILDNRVKERMEEEKAEERSEDGPQMNPYNHEDLVMEAQELSSNQGKSHQVNEDNEDPSKCDEMSESGDTLDTHKKKLENGEDPLLEEEMKEGEILATEKEMEEAKLPVERKQSRNSISTEMEEQSIKRAKVAVAEDLLDDDAGGACTQVVTYAEDVPGGELLLQEEHDEGKGRKEHVGSNPVGSIFKIKPTAVINSPVPWINIKPVLQNGTQQSMNEVNDNDLGPWSSEEMSEDEKPAAKEAMNMEEEFSLNSTNDGMHEPSEMSPRRNRIRKKTRTNKHKKKKGPGMPPQPTVRRLTRSITANLKGNSDRLLSQIEEKEKDMSPTENFLYAKIERPEKVKRVNQSFKCIACQALIGYDALDLMCRICYDKNLNAMKEIHHVPSKFDDGILNIDHQIFQTLVQRVIEAFVGQRFRLSNHPVTKRALKEAVMKCNEKQSANTNQKTYKNYKLNGAAVDPNDKVFQYTFFMLILSEWKAACISRGVAVEKSCEFFELSDLNKAMIMSIMQEDIDNVTQLLNNLKKEYEEKVQYTQDGSPLTNEFKCLVHYDSVQDTFFCENSVLGIVIETLTEFLLPAPDGSLRHDIQEDHELEVQEVLNKLYNFDHIRNEQERSIVNEEDRECLDLTQVQLYSFLDKQTLESIYKVAECASARMRREDSAKEESDTETRSSNGLKVEDIEKLDAIFSNMKVSKSSSETSSVPSSLPGLTLRKYSSSSYSGDSLLKEVASILLDEIVDDPSVQEVREEVAYKLTDLDEYLHENLLMDAGRTIPNFPTPFTAEQMAERVVFDCMDHIERVYNRQPEAVEHHVFREKIKLKAFEDIAEEFKIAVMRGIFTIMGQSAAPFMAENAVFYITKRITIPGNWPQQELIDYLADCYEILIFLPNSHFTVTNYNTEQKDGMKNNTLICAQQRNLKTQLLAQPDLLEKPYEEVKKEVIKTCGNINYVRHTSDINPGRFLRQQGPTPCVHCRGTNHRSHECYFVIGFPERHHSRPQYFAPPRNNNQMRRNPVLNQPLFQQQGNNNAWRPQANVPTHNNNYNRANNINYNRVNNNFGNRGQRNFNNNNFNNNRRRNNFNNNNGNHQTNNRQRAEAHLNENEEWSD